MIPNPRGSVLFVGLIVAVEDGGGSLGDRLGAAAEALDVVGGGGGPGVADEASDVLQGLVSVHEQCGVGVLVLAGKPPHGHRPD